jgi:hypothetical protein
MYVSIIENATTTSTTSTICNSETQTSNAFIYFMCTISVLLKLIVTLAVIQHARQKKTLTPSALYLIDKILGDALYSLTTCLIFALNIVNAYIFASLITSRDMNINTEPNVTCGIITFINNTSYVHSILSLAHISVYRYCCHHMLLCTFQMRQNRPPIRRD